MPRPRRPWFRFYVEAVHDRKLRRLKPETRWLFVACLAAARASNEPGWLLVGDDPMTSDDIEDYAGMARKQVTVGMAALCGCGILGFDLTRTAWFVPNWDERQYESDDVTARSQRFRARRSNVANPFPASAPENREQRTDTDVNNSCGVKRVSVPADWTPRPSDERWARDAGYADWQVLRQTERFIAKNLTDGTTFSDTAAAWRSWMLNEEPRPMDSPYDDATDLLCSFDLKDAS